MQAQPGMVALRLFAALVGSLAERDPGLLADMRRALLVTLKDAREEDVPDLEVALTMVVGLIGAKG